MNDLLHKKVQFSIYEFMKSFCWQFNLISMLMNSLVRNWFLRSAIWWGLIAYGYPISIRNQSINETWCIIHYHENRWRRKALNKHHVIFNRKWKVKNSLVNIWFCARNCVQLDFISPIHLLRLTLTACFSQTPNRLNRIIIEKIMLLNSDPMAVDREKNVTRYNK